HFDDASLQIWFEFAAFGAFLILLGIFSFIIQLVVSFRRRVSLADTTGDPWNGRTLEWSTSSPPPVYKVYNFAFTPIVHVSDAWYDMKKRGHIRPVAGFVPIHMPKNTGAGFVLAVLSMTCGFGMIWHMWPVAAAGFVTLIVAAIIHTFNYDRELDIPAESVLRTEDARTQLLASHV
ncbi:MAG: cytochrome o ubiquinol oxidase subunit I, partial [Betaproteobacteria bacterium]